ncbi:dTDP-4-dehydrorhamnose 3,5-epimerase family protein [Amycolatopsis sp. CA-230715]|uniref:dTDP-4-dehydrorhamnose 3,5-epimerase family protein n=1 Tax=Amycolatopsis sp. CA-230715 TaxID=2745196 RepID=UPI001C033FBD|nr:dTDP-4-dehydrorhamnose 3,5-epimerase [Amycolatopsis sp. CA-230715]QWF84533.1 dTDP-4-dehydro-6-deoxyglucose 3-epimerase [Amycolatopsis sp. CA-230715]
MDIRPLNVLDAYQVTPVQAADRRGAFFESVRFSALSQVVGHPVRISQVNFSVSRKNTLRGIHGTALPPGQAKFVTCVRGAVLDAVVDLRVGSPTFGQYAVVPLDEESGAAVYIADGLGHAFLARTDGARMAYFCSTEYTPAAVLEIDALDPDIGLPWGLSEEPIRSAKDLKAPPLADLADRRLLPTYAEFQRAYRSSRVEETSVELPALGMSTPPPAP